MNKKFKIWLWVMVMVAPDVSLVEGYDYGIF